MVEHRIRKPEQTKSEVLEWGLAVGVSGDLWLQAWRHGRLFPVLRVTTKGIMKRHRELGGIGLAVDRYGRIQEDCDVEK